MKRRLWSHYINLITLDSSIIYKKEDHIFKPNIRMCDLTNMFVPIRMTRENIYNDITSHGISWSRITRISYLLLCNNIITNLVA